VPTESDDPTVDLVLSAEVAHTSVRRVPGGTVRISKRVVTEARTVTVQIRREELHVERIPAPTSAPADHPGGAVDRTASATEGQEPVLVLVLHEEVPEVSVRVVATERVGVFVDRVEGVETVDTALRHEEVALTEEQLPL
jgi:uncharacterized protein (TIGR02271 family)